jgi:hypothetical protein
VTILDTVLAEAGPSRVVVFDLDSTLLDNRPRQARILNELGAAWKLVPLESAMPEHWTSWSIEEAMRNAGLTAGEAARLAPEARGFWRERFFTSDYCLLDGAIAGAADYVTRLAARCRVIYCTGRHEAMRPGSEQSMARLGFPSAELLMKPTYEQHDDDWKRQACEILRARGRVLAAFDNEPTHANIYAAAFPEARIIHLATDHSGRPVTLAAGVVSISHF